MPAPPGSTFDPITGALDGPLNVGGVYVLGFTPFNASGDGLPLVVPFGIAPVAISPDSSSDVTMDMVSRLVTPSAAAPSNTPAPQGTEPIFIWKEGDDLMLYNRFAKAGAFLDRPATEVVLSIKNIDTEAILLTSSGWFKQNSGSSAVYITHTFLDPDILAGVLSDHEDDNGTYFDALCEISLEETNPLTGDVGPATVITRSQNFRVRIYRSLDGN